MSRRKGELSPAGIDRGWPHQVALLASLSAGKLGFEQDEFCKALSRCVRHHRVFFEDECYIAHCFAVKEDAELFMARYGGEWFDPRDRGGGHDWFRWYKGSQGKRKKAGVAT